MRSAQAGLLSHVDERPGMVSMGDSSRQVADLGEGVSDGGRSVRGEVSRGAHRCPLQTRCLERPKRGAVPQRERSVLRRKAVGVDGRDP